MSSVIESSLRATVLSLREELAREHKVTHELEAELRRVKDAHAKEIEKNKKFYEGCNMYRVILEKKLKTVEAERDDNKRKFKKADSLALEFENKLRTLEKIARELIRLNGVSFPEQVRYNKKIDELMK
jgi:hypothetical protein